MTAEQKAQAVQLRSEGKPYLKIAAKIGVSESAAYKFLTSLSKPPPSKPKPIPKQKPKLKTPLLPPHEFHHVASCPMRRHINPEARNLPQLTKAQLIFDLERAWRNTAQLSS
jgi:hypothetical protein